jgi:hypothetical protein
MLNTSKLLFKSHRLLCSNMAAFNRLKSLHLWGQSANLKHTMSWVVYFQNYVRWPRPPSKMAAMSRHIFNIIILKVDHSCHVCFKLTYWFQRRRLFKHFFQSPMLKLSGVMVAILNLLNMAARANDVFWLVWHFENLLVRNHQTNWIVPFQERSLGGSVLNSPNFKINQSQDWWQQIRNIIRLQNVLRLYNEVLCQRATSSISNLYNA